MIFKQKKFKIKNEITLKYCNYASQYAEKSGGKQWGYMIIPHREVLFNKDFGYFVSRFLEK